MSKDTPKSKDDYGCSERVDLKHDRSKKFHTPGYFWMPAALTNASMVGYIGVKYEKNEHLAQKVFKTGNAPGVYAYRYPDRTLYYSAAKLPDKFKAVTDVQVNYAMSKGSKLLSKLVKYAMYNAWEAPKRKHSVTRDKVRDNAFIVQDSGGFQLHVGRVDFIDPLEVMRQHNIYADTGVGLDIPLYGVVDPRFVSATAKILALNNKVMDKARHPEVSLMNVSHGMTLKSRVEFLDICMKEPLQSLCIGSVKSSIGNEMKPTRFVAHIMTSIFHTEKNYQHYHVLGVSTRWQMALIALIAKKTGKTITSDSSTYAKGAFNGRMFSYSGQDVLIGKPRHPSLSTLNCGCPACQLVGYEGPYRATGQLMMIHNLWSLAKTAKNYNYLAQNYDPDKWYFEEVPHQDKHKHEIRAAIKIIREAKNVSDLMKMTRDKQYDQGGLFANPATLSADLKRKLVVIREYEKYHGVKVFKE